MKKVAMQWHEKACAACHCMANFFCLYMLGKKWWARERRVKNFEKKRATIANFELFGQLLLFLFFFAQNFRSNSKSYLLEDLLAGPTSASKGSLRRSTM